MSSEEQERVEAASEPREVVSSPAEELPPREVASAEEAPSAEEPPEQPAAGEPPAGPPRRRAEGERERRPRGFRRRKVCAFCVEKATSIDYKDAAKLRRYLSDRARIEPRRKTGTCAKHQRWLSVALKRARYLALLPYTPEHIRLSGAQAGRR